ncbi:L,D-transpeptidase family protein [Desulfobotulus alkaliphilus]|uniref:L,D-transpeptidase family protein n=1 Tax=Desulfobotulus alkaliphilus TaxID=622671 RepID=UPI001645D805|nr:L,D-transpeptidase family protein [Desulfobotulus alkaliphilus]
MAQVQVPDVFIHTESRPFTAVVVERATQRLWVYAKDNDGFFYERHSFPCSTGEVAGDKRLEGDRKTPGGVYFFLTEHEERFLAPIYGTGAFPIDYPNFMDQREGRTGNAIWLHGTNKALRPMDSNGCVALENHNLDAMKRDIRLLRTPMIIVEKLGFQGEYPQEKTVENLKKLIHGWKNALRSESYHAYLAAYSADFLPDIAWWSDWLILRSEFEAENIDLMFEIKDLDLFRTGDRVTGIFDFMVRAGESSKNLGTRLLYMEPDAYGNMRIVGDPWLAPPESLLPAGKPLMAGLNTFSREWNAEDRITRMVDDWLEAWSSQEIEPYGAFYAEGFRSQGRNRRAWLRYKEGLNRQYDYIRVKREGPLDIRMRGAGRAEVRFVQNYESSGFATRGRKRLDLIREDGRWKIYREIWEG